MKKLSLALLLVAVAVSLAAQAQPLNMFVEMLRFQQVDLTTKFDINYKIPYTSLVFMQGEHGYEANVEVAIDVLREEGYRNIRTFTNAILTTDVAAPYLASRYYLDKISLTLKDELDMRIRFTDLASGKTFVWVRKLELLKPKVYLSDLELSSDVRRDTTGYLEKFRRGDRLFITHPDHVFNSLYADTLWVYAEYMAPRARIEDDVTIMATLSGVGDGVSVPLEPFKFRPGFNEILIPIRLIDMAEGNYTLTLDVMFPGDQPIRRETYVIRRVEKSGVWRIFQDLDDEKMLLGYFIPDSELRSWDNLTAGGKKNFLDDFWNSIDPTPGTPNNEFFQIVSDRVRFTNENYSVYTEGWKSDRGRIYIRNGPPDEIVKDTTSGSAPALRDESNTEQGSMLENPLMDSGLMGARDYQIWRYYKSGSKKTYLFFDKATSGNLKLIYADGDDREVGEPQWRYFMGNSFDETELDR